jgi:hypothetical protein
MIVGGDSMGNVSEGVDVSSLGLVRGVVVSVDDPLKLCRLRVRVPSIHGADGMIAFMPDEELPWAYPSLPANMKQVPKVGDFVWLMFENNRVEMPVYLGVVLGKGGVDLTKPKMLGQGGTPSITTGTYEAPYEGNKAGTIFESVNGFSFNYDDGDAPDGSDGVVNIEKEDMKLALTRDYIDISVSGAVMNVTKEKISISTGSGTTEVSSDKAKLSVGSSTVDVEASKITLSIGGSSIELSEGGITLSIGGTSIALTGGSLILNSPIIHENP